MNAIFFNCGEIKFVMVKWSLGKETTSISVTYDRIIRKVKSVSEKPSKPVCKRRHLHPKEVENTIEHRPLCLPRCPALHDDIHHHWIVFETWLHPIGSPAATQP